MNIDFSIGHYIFWVFEIVYFTILIIWSNHLKTKNIKTKNTKETDKQTPPHPLNLIGQVKMSQIDTKY